MLKSIQKFVEGKLSVLVLVILAIQPPMDVLSYFLMERGNTSFSTALRFLLLVGVALLGFLLTDRKRLYFLFYGIAGAFWILHALNCFRIGYNAPVSDAANFLRILNFPIFTLSFITFFQKGAGIRKSIIVGFAVSFGEVVLFTALPWLMGQPVYTYRALEVGVMGWAGVPSAQSAIIVLLVPMAMLWAYRTGKYLVFLGVTAACFGLMFVTGTKLTFYSILIVAAGFVLLFVLSLGKKSWKYLLPLAALMAVVIVFRGSSPMAVRQRMSDYSQGTYQSLVSESLKSSGADEEIIREVQEGVDVAAAAASEAKMEMLRRNVLGVYTSRDVYGAFFQDFHDRFGAYNVMDAYEYTTDTSILSDTRVRKTMFAKLMWEEKDFLTKVLGFEYSDMLMGTGIYDLENDFPAVFYFCGYLGFGLYMLFVAYLFFIMLRAFFRDMAACVQERKGKTGNPFVKGFGSFWKGLQRFLTVEMGAVGMTFLLSVIAAQISGNVLRRPNVTVYFAIAAAMIYHLTVDLRRKDKPHDLSGGF